MSVGYDLDQGVIVALAVATSKPIGYGNLPTGHGPTYIIVTPFGEPLAKGDMGSRRTNQDYRYAIRCVGEDMRQVQWLKDKVFTRLVEGAMPTASVQWVARESGGAIVPDGETLFSCVDTYLLRV